MACMIEYRQYEHLFIPLIPLIYNTDTTAVHIYKCTCMCTSETKMSESYL